MRGNSVFPCRKPRFAKCIPGKKAKPRPSLWPRTSFSKIVKKLVMHLQEFIFSFLHVTYAKMHEMLHRGTLFTRVAGRTLLVVFAASVERHPNGYANAAYHGTLACSTDERGSLVHIRLRDLALENNSAARPVDTMSRFCRLWERSSSREVLIVKA